MNKIKNAPKGSAQKNIPYFNREEVSLIIGLGNSSPQYQNTYHNAGFLAIDYFKKHKMKLSPHALLNLLKTKGYMNTSGSFVKKALLAHHAALTQLLVIHDDSDIELGKYKFSYGKRSAGHKGVEDIISKLHSNLFWRLRIGVRKKDTKEKADDFVLKEINSSQIKTLHKVFEKSLQDILTDTHN